jgi:protein-tyrosine phosphatase
VIDLHSHLLPAVDDGVRTLERAVQVLEQMAGRGVTDVCLTPHLEASRAEQGIPASHDDAYVRLVGAAPAQVRLHRGVELMLDRPFPPAAAADRRLTLGGSRYILVEFMPMVSPLAATNALAHVTNLGMVPVLAHPERYACTTPGIVAQWKAGGAVMQVDANTLFARRRRGERARALVAAGLADILAADNHGDPRTVSEPYLHLCELGGGEQADLLLRRNPGGILADAATLEAVPPLQFKTSLLDRLRKLLDQEE